MELELRNGRCIFTFGFFLTLAIGLLLDRTGMGTPALCAAALHESGHLLALRFCHGQVRTLSFLPFGVRLEKAAGLSARQEALVFAAGVLCNAAALGTVALLWSLLTSGVPLGGSPVGQLRLLWSLKRFFLCNLMLLVFNLLPIGRLDGGQLAGLLFAQKLAPRAAHCAKLWLGGAFLALLTAAAIATLREGGWLLLFTCAYLAATLARDT